jgi:hypothetical protein
MTNINIEAVINDLAEQVKKLTVDNAILRSALAQVQQNGHSHEDGTANDEISASAEAD